MQYNSWLYLFPFLGGSIILYYLIFLQRYGVWASSPIFLGCVVEFYICGCKIPDEVLFFF